MPVFNKPGYKLQCYECQNVKSEAECDKNIVTCADTALSCQTHIRIWNGGKAWFIITIYKCIKCLKYFSKCQIYKSKKDVTVTKGCKQPLACFNNFIQNPRDAMPYSQCQNYGTFNKNIQGKDSNGTFPNWVNPNPQYLTNSVCRCCCDTPFCNHRCPFWPEETTKKLS